MLCKKWVPSFFFFYFLSEGESGVTLITFPLSSDTALSAVLVSGSTVTQLVHSRECTQFSGWNPASLLPGLLVCVKVDTSSSLSQTLIWVD